MVSISPRFRLSSRSTLSLDSMAADSSVVVVEVEPPSCRRSTTSVCLLLVLLRGSCWLCARLVAAAKADDAAAVVLVESSENSAARATLISEGEARTNFRRRCVACTCIIFCSLAVLEALVLVAAGDADGRALFILPPFLPLRTPPLVLAAASPMLPREGDRIVVVASV